MTDFAEGAESLGSLILIEELFHALAGSGVMPEAKLLRNGRPSGAAQRNPESRAVSLTGYPNSGALPGVTSRRSALWVPVS